MKIKMMPANLIVLTIGTAAVLLFMNTVVFAAAANVVNNVSVSANTGGNSSGSIQTGRASVDVYVDQSINGVAQPPINISTSSASGSIYVEVHSNVSGSGSTTVATSSVSVSSSPPAAPRPHLNFFPPLPTRGAATTSHAASTSSEMRNLRRSFTNKLNDFFVNLFGWIFKWKR